jgi:hypothetical protein
VVFRGIHLDKGPGDLFIRGTQCGWYAIEDDGDLSSGPFSNREKCLRRITADERNWGVQIATITELEHAADDTRRRGRRREVQPNPSPKDERHERDHYERHDTENRKTYR